MAIAVDKRGLDLPTPTGGLGAERARVVRHVKVNESSRMARMFPQRDEVTSSGVYPQRWWEVLFSDGSSKRYYVVGQEVQTG